MKISPSVLSADLANLYAECVEIARAGADMIHLDVMDGAFVPNLTFGAPVIRCARPAVRIPFDVHLMIEEPGRYIDDLAEVGADLITVHAEACKHLDRTIEAIKEKGLLAGVALNPATPLSAIEWILPKVDMVLIMSVNPGFGGQKLIPYTVEKVRALKKMIDEKGLKIDIEVDGGVNLENVTEVMDAGANIIVAGSAVFKGDISENVERFLDVLKE